MIDLQALAPGVYLLLYESERVRALATVIIAR
jgi:hypothetical protein